MKNARLADNLTKCEAVTLVRVCRGQLGAAWENGQPVLLKEGLHVYNAPTFKIVHGTLTVLRVQKGFVAKVFEDQLPYLLGEGLHWRTSASFEFKGLAALTEEIIQHGTITRFRVEKGKVALCWHANEPVFLEEPGQYQFDTPFFLYERAVPVTDRVIALGSKKVVTVQSGEVGISYDHGALTILEPGRHVIESSEHLFDAFWSTQQRSMRLAAVGQGRKQPEEVLICETKDLVKVGIRADVFFAIDDPAKCLVSVGRDQTEVLVRETSIATLTNIIRSTALNEIAQSKLPSAVSEGKLAREAQNQQAIGASAPLFFDKAHDDFLGKLHDDFLAKYGINISNIRIESFKIMDEGLANSISKQAVVTAQTQSQLANLKGETEIATATQEREAQVLKIQADAKAKVLAMSTEAENKMRVANAEATAQARAIEAERAAEAQACAVRRQAEAEADAIRLKAEAEAHAIAVKAEAEAKRASQVGATDLGRQLALLGTYAGIVQKSNEGVSKVVYCDPALKPGNPLGLMTLDGLAGEMQTLQGSLGGK